MLASANKNGIPDVASASAAAAASESQSGSQMSESGSSAPTGNMAQRNTARANGNPGGRRGALQGRVIGNLPTLSGLQQIVGLALGSPEFQRR